MVEYDDYGFPILEKDPWITIKVKKSTAHLLKNRAVEVYREWNPDDQSTQTYDFMIRRMARPYIRNPF